MKKAFALILALAMGCTMLSSCAGLIGTKDSDSSDSEYATEERKFEQLVKEREEKGTCTISVDLNQKGQSLEGYLTTDGESTYIEAVSDGVKVVVLIAPDAGYILDVEGKKYYKAPLDQIGDSSLSKLNEATLLGDTISMDGLTYKSTKKDTIDGKEYVVESYLHQDGSFRQFVFDDNNDIVYLGNGQEYMKMFYSVKPDTSKLSIDDWTEMSDEEFISMHSKK